MKKNLKPVVFVSGNSQYYSNNVFQQNQLLKAMQTTVDVNELRKAINVKSKAMVYRTLDKLAIRKEYHESLIRNDLTLDSIVVGLKNIAENSFKDTTKLSAYKTILRSLGLDKYEDMENVGKSWEEVLMKAMEGDNKQLKEAEQSAEIEGEYEVKVPEAPQKEKNKRLVEQELADQLYK